MERVGILGSGAVGQALGRGFAKHGWEVMVGSRSPDSEKLAEWLRSVEGEVRTGTFAEAAVFGGVVIIATLGGATEAALELAGPKNLANKLVIDATNPLDFSSMPPGLLLGSDYSNGERVQRKLPGAKVVKCFNTVPNPQMIDPKFEEGTPPMLICGNDLKAKKRVEVMLRDLGWPGVIDIGGIEESRWLEALVPLWVRVGTALGTWSHAFKAVT